MVSADSRFRCRKTNRAAEFLHIPTCKRSRRRCSPLRQRNDVSTTMIIQPGLVVDFLVANQNVKDPFSVDWVKGGKEQDGEEAQNTEVTDGLINYEEFATMMKVGID
ncbi:hypothetical protein ACS0TY_032788 [Phlomoides rotata]